MRGTTTLTAASFDNVGVVGVQFLLDGNNLGAEVTAEPFALVWDTTAVSDGPHMLAGRARDAAGNTQTSSPITVYVENGVMSNAGLIAAYAFNEGGGSIAIDSSPTANPANLRAGATWAEGRYGSALAISGSGYANAPDRTELTPDTAATFEAWVYVTSAPIEPVAIVSKWGRSGEDEFLVGLDVDRHVHFAWKTSGGGAWGTPSYNEAFGTGQVPLDTWTHVAVVRDGVTLSIYVDGVLDSSLTPLDANPFRDGSLSLRIGAVNRAGFKRNLTGRIDDVRIYNRALTAEEIQNDMRRGS